MKKLTSASKLGLSSSKELAVCISIFTVMLVSGTLTLAVAHSILKIGILLSILASLPIMFISMYALMEYEKLTIHFKQTEQDQQSKAQ